MTTPSPHRNSFLSNRPEDPTKSPQSPTSSNPITPPTTKTESQDEPTTTTTKKPLFTPPPPNSFAFTSIPVLSLPRAKAFYSTVFNWTFSPQTSPTQLIFFTPSSVMGALSLITGTENNADEPEQRAGGVVNHILVTDVGATLQKVVEAGGAVEREAWVEGGHTELGRFWDTEGNLGGVLRWLI